MGGGQSSHVPAGHRTGGDKRLIGLHQTVDPGERRSPAQFRFPVVSGLFDARLFSDGQLTFLPDYFYHRVQG